MRIVAGTFKGRHLRVPNGRHVRPTTDRVKESLFAILRSELIGARVLDLFAGTGNLGIEALSRGAASVTFVEQHPNTARTLRGNLEALGVGPPKAEIVRGDAIHLLRQFAEEGRRFDLIFADPPYDSGLAAETLQALGITSPVLEFDGVIVLEHARKATVGDFYGTLTRVRIQEYGDTTISFYREPIDATPNES